MTGKTKSALLKGTFANLGFEAQLWAANALRGSMDAAEYKHVVLGLIFLKYISDAFEAHHAKLEGERDQGADLEDPDEYLAENIFWVPPEARWSELQKSARQPTIGELVDRAMTSVESDNPSLKGVLPKDYARPALDKQRLGQLIDLISNIVFRSDQPSPPAPLPTGEGHYRGGFDFSGQLGLALELRKKATPAETLFWELLRDRRFLDLKFRRQHQIGSYIVDFYCDEKKLVVELDGPVHDAPARRAIDHKRDAYLRSLGLTVIRISNQKLLEKTEEALAEIASATLPSPTGRGAGVRGTGFRDRRGEILFIDARKMGRMADRTHRELTEEDIAKIAGTYHAWRTVGPRPASGHPLPA
jgi:very-short-patch-repair endonuclease